jgi:hypothetical protein
MLFIFTCLSHVKRCNRHGWRVRAQRLWLVVRCAITTTARRIGTSRTLLCLLCRLPLGCLQQTTGTGTVSLSLLLLLFHASRRTLDKDDTSEARKMASLVQEVWTVPVSKLGLPGVQVLRLRLKADYGKATTGRQTAEHKPASSLLA